MKKTLERILVVMAAVIISIGFVSVLYFSAGSKDGRDHKASAELWQDGWLLETEDGMVSSLKVPHGKISGSTFRISSLLPRDLASDDVLFLWSDNQNITVTIGQKEVFSYVFEPQQVINKDLSPSRWVIVPLSEDEAGKDIRIDYQAVSGTSGSIGRIWLGNKAYIISAIMRSNAATLLAGLGIFFFGFISLARYFGNRSVRTNQITSLLYRGIAMICASLWFLNQTSARQFLTGNVYLARDLNYLAQIALPVPFVLAAAYLEEKKYFTSARIFCICTLLDDALIFILLLSGTADFRQMNLLVDLPMNLSAVYCGITVVLIFLKDKELFRKLRVTIYAMAVLAVTAVLEIAGQNGFLPVTGIFLPCGILLFAAVTEAVNSVDLMKQVKQDITFRIYRQSQKELLTSVSHELRNPVDHILTLNEEILSRSQDETVHRLSAGIRNAGNDAQSIIGDILEYAESESGGVRIQSSEYSLRALLDDVCMLEQPKAAQKNLAFVIDADPAVPDRLCGDAARIRQVLLNLLDNAVRYTRKGTVTLKAGFEKKDEEHILLIFHVRDTGIGIRHENISRIFRPYVRLDERNDHVHGAGLGLSISENILNLMGSRISVESRYGEGSDFSCRIEQEVRNPAPLGTYTYQPEFLPAADKEKKTSEHPQQADHHALVKLLKEECGLHTEEGIAAAGSESLYVEVVSQFASLGEENTAAIENCIRTAAYGEYSTKVHALYGTAHLIGAEALSSWAEDMEVFAERAKTGDAEARARLDSGTGKLLQDYRSLTKHIKAMYRAQDIALPCHE
ncbi:MAG: HAMP domain-containing sensor histidine kinase [Bulleidia sp.]|nr:HAMP domain-containing sensor histidine kinase [Bulleidia sp.]